MSVFSAPGAVTGFGGEEGGGEEVGNDQKFGKMQHK